MLLTDSNLGPLDLESDALPIEPPRKTYTHQSDDVGRDDSLLTEEREPLHFQRKPRLPVRARGTPRLSAEVDDCWLAVPNLVSQTRSFTVLLLLFSFFSFKGDQGAISL